MKLAALLLFPLYTLLSLPSIHAQNIPEDLKPPYQAADLQKLRLTLRELYTQRQLTDARKVIEKLEQK